MSHFFKSRVNVRERKRYNSIVLSSLKAPQQLISTDNVLQVTFFGSLKGDGKDIEEVRCERGCSGQGRKFLY